MTEQFSIAAKKKKSSIASFKDTAYIRSMESKA